MLINPKRERERERKRERERERERDKTKKKGAFVRLEQWFFTGGTGTPRVCEDIQIYLSKHIWDRCSPNVKKAIKKPF